MIDIVAFIAGQVETWNTEQKCGMCWSFEAPMQESAMNDSIQKTEECCTNVFLTELVVNDNIMYRNGFPEVEYDFLMKLHFLMNDDIGSNTYQEQPYPVGESKWATILKPLSDCIDEGFDYCNTKLQLIKQSRTMRINWMDANYTGWTLSVLIRQKA